MLCTVRSGGVVTLMRPQPSADHLGMGLGLQAAGLSALMFVPVGVVLVVQRPHTA